MGLQHKHKANMFHIGLFDVAVHAPQEWSDDKAEVVNAYIVDAFDNAMEAFKNKLREINPDLELTYNDSM